MDRAKTYTASANPCCRGLNPLPDDKIIDSSKLKEYADDNFKFDKNERKLSKQVENTVGKGEIARYEQFLLFPQCFQVCFPGASKGVIVWEWVNKISSLTYSLIHHFETIPNSRKLQKTTEMWLSKDFTTQIV